MSKTPTNCPYCGHHTRFQVSFGKKKRCGRCGSLWLPSYHRMRPIPMPVTAIGWEAIAAAPLRDTGFWDMLRGLCQAIWKRLWPFGEKAN